MSSAANMSNTTMIRNNLHDFQTSALEQRCDDIIDHMSTFQDTLGVKVKFL